MNYHEIMARLTVLADRRALLFKEIIYSAVNEEGDLFLIVQAQDEGVSQGWLISPIDPELLEGIAKGRVPIHDGFIQGARDRQVFWGTRSKRTGAFEISLLLESDLTPDQLPLPGKTLKVF